jgi:hypothetical protein
MVLIIVDRFDDFPDPIQVDKGLFIKENGAL